jgi:hypothetical protein
MEMTMLTPRLPTCSAFALAGMLATATFAAAQTPPVPQEALVTATGEGIVQAAPRARVMHSAATPS